MSEAVIETVTRAVISRLAERFPTIKIYGDEIWQELNPPAFFVKTLSAERERRLVNGYEYRLRFDVHYFDDTLARRREVADAVYAALDVIALPWAAVRANKINLEDVDRVLHVFVDYVVRVRYENDDPLMRTLTEVTKVG